MCSVNERQVIAHKKIEKYDGKNVLKMCYFNFFRNQLWQHLISCNSFRSVLVESRLVESSHVWKKCRSNHFQSTGVVEKLRTGGGVRNFRTGGVLPIRGKRSFRNMNIKLVESSHVWKMQKQPFPVKGENKKVEDWEGG